MKKTDRQPPRPVTGGSGGGVLGAELDEFPQPVAQRGLGHRGLAQSGQLGQGELSK